MPEPKRIWNPPNPYLTEHRQLLGEPPSAELQIYEDESRSILSHNDSPDIGFRWSVNPYRGCFHACSYCFARPTHEYFGLGAGSDFERKIFVKPDAARLLEAAFRRKSWQGDLVMFSGVTDCYQPLEAAWRLTRQCLETCLAFRNPVGIITKSLLIRRDAELLAALAREADAGVSISIPFLDEKIARLIEPGAPTIKRRFETMEILARAGVSVSIGVAPLIPGLNDTDIPGLLKEAKRRGAHAAFHTLLRLPGSVKDVFFHRLKEVMPLRAARVEHRIREGRRGQLYDNRFGHRHEGTGPYWEAIEQSWAMWTRRLGFAGDDGPPKPSTFRRPPLPTLEDQLEFAWHLDAASIPQP
ncbi:MAG: radical SAM protein [Candidatus Omnitrophica bacterium CG11_big_fil_rev_8_21_14_0_20_63_9]|nr:MAG: radical SAM protein [Candidatus Omnitrophica bacterium CG11_big_fil_rev_8_21_14_0_20_63_9]